MNNFEKIKAMDIDEMAEFFAHSNCEWCIYNPKIYDGSCITEDRDCKVGIKQWLESEARE